MLIIIIFFKLDQKKKKKKTNIFKSYLRTRVSLKNTAGDSAAVNAKVNNWFLSGRPARVCRDYCKSWCKKQLIYLKFRLQNNYTLFLRSIPQTILAYENIYFSSPSSVFVHKPTARQIVLSRNEYRLA